MRAYCLIVFTIVLPGLVFAGGGFFTASSVESIYRPVEHAFDGRGDTFWQSRWGNKEAGWVQVDLGRVVSVSGVNISWGPHFAAKYKFQSSIDGQAWETVYHCTDGDGGKDEIGSLDGKGRYFRILCIKGRHILYQIHEVAFAGNAGVLLEEVRIGEQKRKERAALAQRRDSKKTLLELGIEKVVFATRSVGLDGHWYANFGYFSYDENKKAYGKYGRLCVLDVATEDVDFLIDDPNGTVRDPVVHYDGEKILFSWRKSGTENFLLYEIGVDGKDLKQLTFGKYDDLEPTYLPDGGIVFVSSRCKRYVNCWLTQVTVLYRCDGDGGNIRQLSANIEQDNTPWVLPDGRVLYMRWEYVDRSRVNYHHLWTMNPDGTGQMVYFGNMHPGDVYLDAKPINGTDKVLLIRSPGHGRKEHMGFVATVTDKFGPDKIEAMQDVSPSFGFRDPFPLSEDTFLVARDKKMMLMDSDGEYAEVFSLGKGYGLAQLHEPRPVIKRKRERIIPPHIDLSKSTGTLMLNDVYTGRNMEGVKRGEIKKLLVLETLPKPVNYSGTMEPISYGGTFTLERILGTIPVEEDGSAFMELPANRSLFFVALDENNNSVKRMQSFLTVMPGENTSCIGCHEERGTAPVNRAKLGRAQAMKKAPHKPQPLKGIPELFDFPRDIQPILDKHCIKCHGYDKRKGGVILTGDRGSLYSHSYFILTVRGQISDGRDLAKSNYPPRALGTSASKLMNKIDGGHHNVKLSAHEQDMIRYWIESAAVYPGTYASLGSGAIDEENKQWKTYAPFRQAIANRCISCHKKQLSLPMDISDDKGVYMPNPKTKRYLFSRHLVFNFSRPEKSMMLLAPLAKSAGGMGICKDVFADTSDKDYKAVLAHIIAGKENLTRFDMDNFKPNAGYVREMKRYGVLPDSFDVDKDSIDVYETDLRYWEMLLDN